MKNDSNICTLTDSYKFTHHAMYPKGTEGVYSYFESRKGAEFDETVFFGLQYYVKKYLEGQVVTQEKLASLGALTAGIAHEIKNPLNFVNNFAEISVELNCPVLNQFLNIVHRMVKFHACLCQFRVILSE